MPYHLETGPTLLAIENYLNGCSNAELLSFRRQLQAPGPPLEDVIRAALAKQLASQFIARLGVAPTAQQVTDARMKANARADQVKADIRRNWLGNANTGMYDNDDGYSGKWQFYKGKPERILRDTFRRAIECALGLAPNAASQAKATRRLRFVCMWKCAQAWLEGWMQWST
jgi:type VI protein secretion system component VasK